MSPTVALRQILAAVESTNSSTLPPEKTLGITLSRLGAPTQGIVAGTLSELAALREETFGAPLHAVVIVGKRLHPLEVDYAQIWAVSDAWSTVARDTYGAK